MTDIVERLRDPDTYLNHFENAFEAADEIERLRDQIATVSAINDMEFWKNEYKRWQPQYVALQAERDAAVALLREINERLIYKGRGSTHWEGCEESHPDCAMAKRIEAAIDAAKGEA